MQLGFVTAIFDQLPFEDVLAFAAAEGFQCVEVMCWPEGGPDRRYGGVRHIGVEDFSQGQADDVTRNVRHARCRYFRPRLLLESALGRCRGGRQRARPISAR